MTLPTGRIVHQSRNRLRVRIPAMRGNTAFFARTIQQFERREELAPAAFNPASASLLFTGAAASSEAVAAFAEQADLFVLNTTPERPVPLARRVAEPIRVVDHTIRIRSEGILDLPGFFFILLLFFGIFELVRGNFRTPPWYTLFWYAFGVFSKSVADHYAQIDLPDGSLPSDRPSAGAKAC